MVWREESHSGANCSVLNDVTYTAARTEVPMFLKWAAIFFVIAMVAAAFGFTGIAEGSTEVAKILFYIFLAICFTFLVTGLVVARKLTS